MKDCLQSPGKKPREEKRGGKGTTTTSAEHQGLAAGKREARRYLRVANPGSLHRDSAQWKRQGWRRHRAKAVAPVAVVRAGETGPVRLRGGRGGERCPGKSAPCACAGLRGAVAGLRGVE